MAMEETSLFDIFDPPKASTDWKWSFSDYPKEKNGIKVFSCFACGGGSTMGYKLAGCEVLGCVEIDPKMNAVYVKNHHPKYNYCMDLRDFNKLPNEEIPSELFNLDILDGSPPCTTFSMAGDREESWGKMKKFREGQKEQTLDDLSFVFIDTARKLKPKVIIMENVEGLLLGEAWSYVQRIYAELNDAGYFVHHWLLKGENMGIPQKRHRTFFVAIQKELKCDPSYLNMSFNYEPVPYERIKSEEGVPLNKECRLYKLLILAKHGDKDLRAVTWRIEQKESLFSHKLVYDELVMPTLTAKNSEYFRFSDKTAVPNEDYIKSQTFPDDYDFDTQNPRYVCGMSVPPVMMKRVVTRLIEQGVFDYKKKDGAKVY